MLNKDETNNLISELMEDYDKQVWNRNPTLLLQAADQLNQMNQSLHKEKDSG